MKSFDIKTKIFFGDQALDRLAEIPYQKVLVVTDPFIAQGKMIDLVTYGNQNDIRKIQSVAIR